MTQLVEAIDEHKDAFTYDWRARFGVPLADVLTGRMRWDESLALFRTLVNDPSSYVCAAVHGWPHPWSREAFVAADQYDVFVLANSDGKRDPKPYPRPTDRTPARLGASTRLTQAEVRAALAAVGPRTAPTRRRDARGRFTK